MTATVKTAGSKDGSAQPVERPARWKPAWLGPSPGTPPHPTASSPPPPAARGEHRLNPPRLQVPWTRHIATSRESLSSSVFAAVSKRRKGKNKTHRQEIMSCNAEALSDGQTFCYEGFRSDLRRPRGPAVRHGATPRRLQSSAAGDQLSLKSPRWTTRAGTAARRASTEQPHRPAALVWPHRARPHWSHAERGCVAGCMPCGQSRDADMPLVESTLPAASRRGLKEGRRRRRRDPCCVLMRGLLG